MFRCRVNLLDDTRIERDLEKNAVGQMLFDEVCDHLNLLERGYFGLATWDSSNNKVWLDFSREVHKQIIGHDATFTFNVKFYPPDPSLLAEDLTRYLLCLQLRMDIMTNHLPCPSDMLPVLGSYIVQSEFGDYDLNVHGPGYLSTIPLSPNQTPELEESITELHRTYISMTPAQADENFLQNAMILPLYGVDLHPAKNVSGKDVMLGVSAEEMMVYEGNLKTQGYPWPRVLKISYIRNKFHLRIRHTEDISESTINFILPSYRACKRLWKVAVEHHAFFRNHRQDKYEGLLQLGSRFRFRRNTHTETIDTSSKIKRPGPPVAHTSIKRKAKESMLQAMKSPTRMEFDDWFQVFKFDRSRPTSIPATETTYTYQETRAPTQTEIHRHKEKNKAISDYEEEEDDDIPEEEQDWFQLLSTRAFPKKVSLTSDSEKLEHALPQFWKHSSEDWLLLLYPKPSITSLWELEPTPLSAAEEQKKEYDKMQWEKTTSEESIKIIRKGAQFVSEGAEGLQKIIEEKLEEEDGERLQRIMIDKETTQEIETFDGQAQEIVVERRIKRVEVVEKVQEVMIEVSEERLKALEKRLLEVETIGQRLQDVEELKLRLQEVEMLEQKLQQAEQEKEGRDERDDWYILLDHRPLVASSALIEILKKREAIRLMEEEPVQKVSPIMIRDVWHILLDLLPRSQWATHLPRAPSVEELAKPSVALEERRMREERRRSSQIPTPYTSPVVEVKPETDEIDDWFNLLDASPKETVLGKVMVLYEDTREEKVRLVEEQMSFIKMEMPFEMIPRIPGELQESDRWFLLLDPTPFEKRSIPLAIVERKIKEDEAWRIKEEEKKRELKIIRMEEEKKIQEEPMIVEEKEVQLLPQREAVAQKDIYDDWFIIFDKSPEADIYEDRLALKIQQRVTIVSEQVTIREKEVTIKEKPAVIIKMKVEAEEEEKKVPVVIQDVNDSWFVLFDPAPFVLRSVPIEVINSWVLEERKVREVQEKRIREEERRKRETEERRARIAMQTEEEPEQEGEDWFILLQPASKVDKRAEEERRRKEEEWEKQVMAESRIKGVTILEERAAWLHEKNDWFLLMDASLKGIDVKLPPFRPSVVISPVPVPKPRPEPMPRPDIKPRPEPRPPPEIKPRPELRPHPEIKLRPEIKPRPEATPRPMPPFDQPLTSTPTTQPVPLIRPTYQEETPKRLDITEDSEMEMESVLIRKRMMKRMEGDSIYVRHSMLMLEDSDVTQEVVLKHHASVRELKRIFMEDMPVSVPTEWDKRLSTHSSVQIPQIIDGQFHVIMDTVDTETVIITKVVEEETSSM